MAESYSSFGNPLIDIGNDQPNSAQQAEPSEKLEEMSVADRKPDAPEPEQKNLNQKQKDDVEASPARSRNGPSMPSIPSVSMPSFFYNTKSSDAAKFFLPMLIVGLFLAFITIIIMSVWVNEVRNPKIYPDLCTTSDCLWEASVILENMNQSIDPCQDFFQYACGLFPQNYPRTDFWSQIDWESVIQDKEDDTLMTSLESALPAHSDQNSIVTKMHTYFGTCRDLFTKTKLGAVPIINIIKGLGGWGALYGTFNANDWSKAKLNNVLQILHHTYSVEPFFHFVVGEDTDTSYGNSKNWIIQIEAAQPEISTRYLLYNDTLSIKERQGYNDFIKGYIELLWKDSGFPTNTPVADELIRIVTDDINAVEYFIANYSASHQPIFPSVHQKISYLDSNYGNLISWFDLISSIYPGAGLTTDSMVHVSVQVQNYIAMLTQMLEKFDMKRINNYIMWKMVVKYIHELGWEYLHINRVWALIKYDGWVTFVGHDQWCLIELQRNLEYALSYLFIQDHFGGSSTDTVQAIFDYQKKLQWYRVDGYSWMDQATKTKSLKKYGTLVDKIGYPDWMADEVSVNSYYSTLKINAKTHFQNVVNVYQFQIAQSVKNLVKKTIDPGIWPSYIYNVYSNYDPISNAVYVPAGSMQPPIFDARAPMHVNFGSIGIRIALQLLNTIESYGKYYDENGAYTGPWWSDYTTTKWYEADDCTGYLYNGTTFCEHGSCHVLPHAERMSFKHMQFAAALTIAYDSYQAYMTDHGAEPLLPGLQAESMDQTFFLSAVQTWCYNKEPLAEYSYWYYYNVPIYSLLLNKVLSVMPEFARAFKCSSGSPMVNTTQCPLA